MRKNHRAVQTEIKAGAFLQFKAEKNLHFLPAVLSGMELINDYFYYYINSLFF